ncbi:hypothetical protein F2Q70_00018051 [Brassica cretica]|uniref:Transcription factor CBF/NF-Y/archaeal histone domain-containing protein n=1 Tax=Brassica cretica TaxID=69181 RepID=A0A8S9I285_BRACR|nr:hypothetical protein F2Q70_00018051 [Brassica cretica]KAF2596814.1 hypothetical protein F2Q68_00011038 [Brassica cretica]
MGDEKESSVTSTVAEHVVEAVGIYIFLYIHKPKLVTLKKDMERGGFHGYGKFSLNNTNPSEPAKFLMAAGSMQLSVFNKPNKTANGGEEECTSSDDSKETIQECVSEYISFVTREANERCQREQRKTVTAEDVLWAMSKIGFDDYIVPPPLQRVGG